MGQWGADSRPVPRWGSSTPRDEEEQNASLGSQLQGVSSNTSDRAWGNKLVWGSLKCFGFICCLPKTLWGRKTQIHPHHCQLAPCNNTSSLKTACLCYTLCPIIWTCLSDISHCLLWIKHTNQVFDHFLQWLIHLQAHIFQDALHSPGSCRKSAHVLWVNESYDSMTSENITHNSLLGLQELNFLFKAVSPAQWGRLCRRLSYPESCPYF